MPMHYPPLADGTYRYGDEPRPLPSPEPGPDPLSPNSPPPTAPGLPGDASPPVAPAGSSRPRGTVAAVAIVGGLALVVVAVVGMALFGPGADRSGPTDTIRGPFPGSGPAQAPIPGPGEFTVDGTFTVVSTPADPVSGDRAGCDMPDSLSDIGEGTPLTLVEDHTGREIDARLAYDGGDLSSCMFTFQFPDVTPDGTLYLIELPGRGQLVYTEDELRAGVDISLGR
ncbi:hypothetical protein ACWIFB_13115 [Dietzia sp. NPDC055340]